VTRVHIRTDDDVYRVDAVWLGPPRATFPWRARYSAYGVGLLVMLAVMFVQRRLGIDLGFFSVAWALLITVAITRFVSRRISDERPLLEWLTLFVHELRGPRAKQRTIGGALTTGHVAVRRDRPKLTGAPTAIALPRGSDARGERVIRPRVRAEASDDAGWGPPPHDEDERVAGRPAEPAVGVPADAADGPDGPAVPGPRTSATDTVSPAARPAARRGAHLTPDLDDAVPSHVRAAGRRTRAAVAGDAFRGRRAARPARRSVDGDFGPPSSADIGGPARATGSASATRDRPAGLPPAPDPHAAAAAEASMAAWTGAGTARREPVPARRAPRTVRTPAGDADPDRTQRRPVRPRRRPGWPMSNEPAGSGGPSAPFGPGARSRDARGDDGAATR